jgi:hypothetical protein
MAVDVYRRKYSGQFTGDKYDDDSIAVGGSLEMPHRVNDESTPDSTDSKLKARIEKRQASLSTKVKKITYTRNSTN